MSQTPPTLPDLDALEPPHSSPKWPKVIGIISIVWGVLGISCTGCGGVMLFSMPMMLPPEMTQGGLPPTMQPSLGMLANYAIGMLMSIFLIAAGVATVRREPAGRTLHLVFAGISLITTAFGAYIGYRMQSQMAQWRADHPDSPFAQGGGGGELIGLIIGIALGLAYPIFLFIWFGLIKTKASDMGKDSAVI
jgi:hypothetical protein